MSKIREARCRFIRNWRVDRDNKNLGLIFPAQRHLWERIDAQEEGKKFFVPFPFPNRESDDYHFFLNFIVEALELLPEKVDLAFDIMWKAFESLLDRFLKEKGSCVNCNTTQLLCAYVNKTQISGWEEILENLFSVIPMQSCEYLVKYMFDGYDKNEMAISGESRRILNRLKNIDVCYSCDRLWESISNKYPALLHPDDKYEYPVSHRQVSALFKRYIFEGKEITIGSFESKFDLKKRLALLILGLLYSFRNYRFHGKGQPPFKSSKATLQTYAHAHFCFLSTYIFFTKTLLETNWVQLNAAKIKANMKLNIEIFKELYGRHLNK